MFVTCLVVCIQIRWRRLTVRGMNLVCNIMKDGAHAHADSILKMPHYANLAPQEAATQFYADLLSTDLINTGSRLDYGLAGEAVTSQFPGAEATDKASQSMVSSFAKSIMNLGGIFDTNSQFAIQAQRLEISQTHLIDSLGIQRNCCR